MKSSNRAKREILIRLRKAGAQAQAAKATTYSQWQSDSEPERIERFQTALTANHAEVIKMNCDDIQTSLEKVYQSHDIKRLTVGSNGEFYHSIMQASQKLHIRQFDKEIECWKSELFSEIDAGVTHSLAGIADTGTIVLWPSISEPRTLSLIPPIHIVLIRQSTITSNFTQLMRSQQWHRKMPTNAVLISGPSKTADIQQTLAYGAHGPSKLIVLLIEDR